MAPEARWLQLVPDIILPATTSHSQNVTANQISRQRTCQFFVSPRNSIFAQNSEIRDIDVAHPGGTHDVRQAAKQSSPTRTTVQAQDDINEDTVSRESTLTATPSDLEDLARELGLFKDSVPGGVISNAPNEDRGESSTASPQDQVQFQQPDSLSETREDVEIAPVNGVPTEGGTIKLNLRMTKRKEVQHPMSSRKRDRHGHRRHLSPMLRVTRPRSPQTQSDMPARKTDDGESQTTLWSSHLVIRPYLPTSLEELDVVFRMNPFTASHHARYGSLEVNPRYTSQELFELKDQVLVQSFGREERRRADAYSFYSLFVTEELIRCAAPLNDSGEVVEFDAFSAWLIRSQSHVFDWFHESLSNTIQLSGGLDLWNQYSTRDWRNTLWDYLLDRDPIGIATKMFPQAAPYMDWESIMQHSEHDTPWRTYVRWLFESTAEETYQFCVKQASKTAGVNHASHRGGKTSWCAARRKMPTVAHTVLGLTLQDVPFVSQINPSPLIWHAVLEGQAQYDDMDYDRSERQPRLRGHTSLRLGKSLVKDCYRDVKRTMGDYLRITETERSGFVPRLIPGRLSDIE